MLGLIPANVLLIVGSEYSQRTPLIPLISGSMITGGLSRATPSRIRPESPDRPTPPNHRPMYLLCRHFRGVRHGGDYIPKSPKTQ
jgi:hypothetical protein